MADNYFKEWKSSLDNFVKCVDKSLADIRQQKADIQQIKLDIESDINGRYVSDPKRIVISAPEIVIGNVDRDGVLRGDMPYSHVVIRANDIDIEGTGNGAAIGGSITERASQITTLAVDPGADGLENVVGDISSITQQARSISLQSNDAKEIFTMPVTTPVSGIAIVSDTSVAINAAPSNEVRSKDIDNLKSALKSSQSQLKQTVSNRKKDVEALIDKMEECLKSQEDLTADEFTCSTSVGDIYDANGKLDQLKLALGPAIVAFTEAVFTLAEVNRKCTALDAAKNELSSAKNSFKTKTTCCDVTISGESINITSTDGDGNLRTNPEAAINLQAQKVNITAHDAKGSLMEKGKVRVNAKDIEVSTADFKGADTTNWENPAVGDINIVTKTMEVQSVDYQTKNSKQEIKALTAGGAVNVRVETLNVMAADKDGKATGAVTVNAKALELKSMDVDKEKFTDSKLSEGGTMVMVSEKMWQGSKNQSIKSKQVQIASEKVAVMAKTTAEVQQDKATVQLDGGNLSMAGSKTQIYGETTVNAKTTFKADIEAPKASIKNVEAGSSFKSPNISDGIAVPSAVPTASLSAKLKEEDAPKKQ